MHSVPLSMAGSRLLARTRCAGGAMGASEPRVSDGVPLLHHDRFPDLILFLYLHLSLLYEGGILSPIACRPEPPETGLMRG
ncbi:hypothetical protein DAEQUDRAFT_391551 [Daedalea quercina L-15889]|uniref:Uncharacterized protein n=1 Tax=Daedalea quercina L-15889 TaxID=1314783 RepID=A0A165NVL0_9APHY|nr:hypothetical protein DAEQUDRAFT_391551 [Daedalea quercina L-15889]